MQKIIVRRINNLTEVIKFAGLALIIVLITSCNSNNGDNSNKDMGNSQIFSIGDNPKSSQKVSEMITLSGIRKGGYVVIIPTSKKKNNSQTKGMKQAFNNQGIMGVHVLSIYPKTSLKKTDILTIENACILCLIGENPKQLLKNSQLKRSLIKTMENGTLIGVGGKANDFNLLPN